MRYEKDDHSDDGNTLSIMWTFIDCDSPNLDEEHHDRNTQTIVAASEVDGTSSVFRASLTTSTIQVLGRWTIDEEPGRPRLSLSFPFLERLSCRLLNVP